MRKKWAKLPVILGALAICSASAYAAEVPKAPLTPEKVMETANAIQVNMNIVWTYVACIWLCLGPT